MAGRHFNGYHIRFRDIARGGLRVVLPPSEEAHVTESRRHFMECFGLSWAQQLKNKDIPEGGSKAVCLVTPQPSEDRTELMHGCVKRMTDAMLDLIVPGTADRLVTRDDTAGQPLGNELIFLDEMRLCGVRPNEITFYSLISACRRGLQWQRALVFFDEMRHCDLLRHVINLCGTGACSRS